MSRSQTRLAESHAYMSFCASNRFSSGNGGRPENKAPHVDPRKLGQQGHRGPPVREVQREGKGRKLEEEHERREPPVSALAVDPDAPAAGGEGAEEHQVNHSSSAYAIESNETHVKKPWARKTFGPVKQAYTTNSTGTRPRTDGSRRAVTVVSQAQAQSLIVSPRALNVRKPTSTLKTRRSDEPNRMK